jgi:hypothetical protein
MKVIDEKGEVVLADFLIVGASRSGTTSLYTYLKNHPEIFMPSLKEPQFFSYLGENFSPHPDDIRSVPWNVEDYLKLFKSAGPAQIIGEASTSYLHIYPRTQKNIHAVYGNQAQKLKIVGVLRNPVSRAWSIYMLKRQGGTWKKSFLEVAREFENKNDPYAYYNFLESGLYYKQVKAYQEMFPATKFFLFEELKSEPERVVRELLEFVGVRNTSIPANVGTKYNFSGVPRNAWVAPFYRFLFYRNPLKTHLKRIIPETVRMYIKRVIGSKVVKRSEMPDDVRQYLLQTYESDLMKLPELLPHEHQKKIIEGWLG